MRLEEEKIALLNTRHSPIKGFVCEKWFFFPFPTAPARNLVSLKTSHFHSEVQVSSLVFSDHVPGQGTAKH